MRQDELKAYAREESDQPPRVYGLDDAIVIELHGEVDVVAYQRSVSLVDAVTAGPEPVVIIDLSQITFIDCSGLSLLMRAHRRVTTRGRRLRIVCTHPLTLRMLRVTQLTAALSPAPTLSAALRDPTDQQTP
ncbi:STAS domain-containing protein [Streptomyces sp. KL118A]|uniref:STAS domain-containing protein n=1 Tax=Streptomyces sp. KL118A TaxID=3045153 RepID=UPI00278BFD47|nr:STAS domain-containing protein [Streptomyces sp. KL118A]